MENIKRCMQSNSDITIELTNFHAPDDGTTSLCAVVKDAYTNEVLIELSWYYDFDELMRDLNDKMVAI